MSIYNIHEMKSNCDVTIIWQDYIYSFWIISLIDEKNMMLGYKTNKFNNANLSQMQMTNGILKWRHDEDDYWYELDNSREKNPYFVKTIQEHLNKQAEDILLGEV